MAEKKRPGNDISSFHPAQDVCHYHDVTTEKWREFNDFVLGTAHRLLGASPQQVNAEIDRILKNKDTQCRFGVNLMADFARNLRATLERLRRAASDVGAKRLQESRTIQGRIKRLLNIK